MKKSVLVLMLTLVGTASIGQLQNTKVQNSDQTVILDTLLQQLATEKLSVIFYTPNFGADSSKYISLIQTQFFIASEYVEFINNFYDDPKTQKGLEVLYTCADSKKWIDSFTHFEVLLYTPNDELFYEMDVFFREKAFKLEPLCSYNAEKKGFFHVVKLEGTCPNETKIKLLAEPVKKSAELFEKRMAASLESKRIIAAIESQNREIESSRLQSEFISTRIQQKIDSLSHSRNWRISLGFNAHSVDEIGFIDNNNPYFGTHHKEGIFVRLEKELFDLMNNTQGRLTLAAGLGFGTNAQKFIFESLVQTSAVQINDSIGGIRSYGENLRENLNFNYVELPIRLYYTYKFESKHCLRASIGPVFRFITTATRDFNMGTLSVHGINSNDYTVITDQPQLGLVSDIMIQNAQVTLDVPRLSTLLEVQFEYGYQLTPTSTISLGLAIQNQPDLYRKKDLSRDNWSLARPFSGASSLSYIPENLSLSTFSFFISYQYKFGENHICKLNKDLN